MTIDAVIFYGMNVAFVAIIVAYRCWPSRLTGGIITVASRNDTRPSTENPKVPFD